MKKKTVVFGESLSPQKDPAMDLTASKYLRKPKEKNPWREVLISESNLIVALEFAMRQTTQLKRSEHITHLIVGEPSNGSYPLTVAILKRKEED